MAQFADNLNEMIDRAGRHGSRGGARTARTRRQQRRASCTSQVRKIEGAGNRADRPDGGRRIVGRQACRPCAARDSSSCCCWSAVDEADGRSRDRVAELLGREPAGRVPVVVRDRRRRPVVLRNAPFLARRHTHADTLLPRGRPLVRDVSRLEAAGGVQAAEAAVDPDEIAAAHERYAAERDAEIAADHVGPRRPAASGEPASASSVSTPTWRISSRAATTRSVGGRSTNSMRTGLPRAEAGDR